MPSVTSARMASAFRYTAPTDYTSPTGAVETSILRAGQELRSIPLLAEPDSYTLDSSLSADETRLAIPIEQEIHVYDLIDGSLQKLRMHTSEVTGLEFSPNDSDILVSASEDGFPKHIIAWDLKIAMEADSKGVASEGELASIATDVAGHAGVLLESRSLGFELKVEEKMEMSNEINKLLAQYQASRLVPDGRKIVGLLTNSFGSKAFSPDGKRLVYLPNTQAEANGDDQWDINIHNLENRSTITLSGHRDAIMGVYFSPDLQTIVSAGFDEAYRVWDMGGGPRHVLETGGQNWGGAFSPDSKYFLGTDGSGKVRVWDVVSGDKKFEWDYGHWCRPVDWSPDGKWFAIGGDFRARLVIFNVVDPSFSTPPLMIHDRHWGSHPNPQAVRGNQHREDRRLIHEDRSVLHLEFLPPSAGIKLASISEPERAVEVFDLESGRKWRVFPSNGKRTDTDQRDQDEDEGEGIEDDSQDDRRGRHIGFHWLKEKGELMTVSRKVVEFWRLE